MHANYVLLTAVSRCQARGSKSPQSSLVSFFDVLLPQVGCAGLDGARRAPIPGGDAICNGADGMVSEGLNVDDIAKAGVVGVDRDCVNEGVADGNDIL
jgi:hypothetical protein